MKTIRALVLLAAASAVATAGEVRISGAPTASKAGEKTVISFAVSAATDVEVAVLDAKGKIVRHLAAGVLGAKAPPPAPLKPGLSQKLEWDGRDDFGEAARGGPFKVRVRAGMAAKLERIVGGDPYAFYSKEMGQGDHSAWRITGLEVKPDGFVYVMGNANNYGPPAIRRYDVSGEYVKTVYPPPAGMKPDQVRGWGIIEKPDGTYTFAYNDLSSPALSKTLICGTRGRIANLIPSPAKDQLLLEYNGRLMRLNTDSSIPANPTVEGLLVNEPPIGSGRKKAVVTEPMQVAISPDRTHFYLGGVFGAASNGRSRTGAATTGPWRDGQVYRVDAATRKATVFFALDEKTLIGPLAERGKSPIADFKYGTYAALQGVAVDEEGHVFVCDRQNKRVLVLDSAAKIIREIPLTHPDAVAVAPGSKTLYVTTRFGHFHGHGKLVLHKFGDWSRDSKPSATVELCKVSHFNQATRLAVAKSEKGTFVWVAYSALPVRVFQDKGGPLELVKDFYRDGKQRFLDVQHMAADQKTDHLYFADGFNNCFRITDWKKPNFERCMVGEDTKLRTLSLSVDSRNRFLYCHRDRTPVVRYKLDGEFLPEDVPGGKSAAPAANTKAKRRVRGPLTPAISNDWRIGLGMGDRGIAAAPDGSVVTMNALGTGANYGGYLHFYRADPAKIPWKGLLFKCFGEKVKAGGARFDVRGNLYAGKVDGKPENPPKGFESDSNFARSTGRIYKFTPTGKLGDLFPKAPDAPAKVYDVHYGVIGPSFSRTPRFGVDGWGRIYYPTSLLPRVSV
ncbi:MAG: SMP-30/gluconolactonase/LRE family protein, partial [Planctomycetota bacterium]